MNLNTVTRKILLLARSLHLKSLDKTVEKARHNTEAAIQARRIVAATLRTAEREERKAIDHEAAVRSAVATERRELGLN